MLTKSLTPALRRFSLAFDWRTSLAIMLTVVFWGSAFAGIRAGLQGYSPQDLALLRYLTASGVLAVYALATKMPLPQRRDLPGIALAGFLGFTFYNLALNVGEEHLLAGTASLIVASAPIYVTLFAAVALRERLTLRTWAGILLSFAGVALITIEPDKGLGLSVSALIVLAAAVAQAVYSVSQKPYLQRYTALQFTACAIWFGTLCLLVFAPGLGRQMRTASWHATLAVIYMGVFPGAIGYVCWAYVLSRLPASKASSFIYLVPVAAMVIAWFWLGELPTLAALAGGGLILAGIVLVNLRRRTSR